MPEETNGTRYPQLHIPMISNSFHNQGPGRQELAPENERGTHHTQHY